MPRMKPSLMTTSSTRNSVMSKENMGPLERSVYRKDRRASEQYLQLVTEKTKARPLLEQSDGIGESDIRDTTARHPARRTGFSGLRAAQARAKDLVKTPEHDTAAPTPGRVVARLLLARLFDRNPLLLKALRSSTPVILVDVADPLMFSRIAHQWKDALSLEDMQFVKFASLSDAMKREDYDGISLVTNDSIPPKDRPALDARAFVAIQLALPILAITPAADIHLSSVLLDAATARLTLPPIDVSLIERTIRVVTGKRCYGAVPGSIVQHVGLREILLSVRFDRTPAQCVKHLVRLASKKTASGGSRELTLDDLHGLDEAVEWARSTIVDIEAWRRNELDFHSIDAGVIMNGPPGTGKTTLAKCFAAAAKLPFATMSFSKFQGSGEGHLGHFLRQMRADFQEARSKVPGAIVLIDELDSFADRAQITHSHKDYVVAVVNGLIEMIGGVEDQRLIFVGCTNDVTRCDPALIRAGRFNRVINIGLPTPVDIEKMLRVRLRGELIDQPIDDVALLAAGATGADVERIVKDARRFARHQKRAIAVDDLRTAIGGSVTLSEETLQRAAVHEAGHIIISVIHNGPSEIHAVVGAGRGTAGMVASYGSNYAAGTAAECRRSLQILLAGRAAEEIECEDGGGNGAGGNIRSDLALATRIAAAMIGSYGHSGPHPLVYVRDHFATEEIIRHRYMRDAVQRELSRALGESKNLLTNHRSALREVARRLFHDRKIDGIEVARIVNLSSSPHQNSYPATDLTTFLTSL